MELPKKKFKQILKKFNIIKPKIIEDDTKFFFWKELIQQYSSKNNMCIFIENESLLPDNLRLKMINCVKNIMDKYNIDIKQYDEKEESLIFFNLEKTFGSSLLSELYQYKDEINNYIIKFLNDEYLPIEFAKIIDNIYYNIMKNKYPSIDKKELISRKNRIHMIVYHIMNDENIIIQERLLKEKYNKLKSESYYCKFIRSKKADVILQRKSIECMEKILSMNMHKLSLCNRIKILKILESTLPEINLHDIEYFKRKINIKTLDFQIINIAIRQYSTNSRIIFILENIINDLNIMYLNPSNKELHERIKFISTIKYYKPFIFECKIIISMIKNIILISISHFNNYLNELQILVHESPTYEPIIYINKLEDYIIYLLNFLKFEKMDTKLLHKYDQEYYKNYSKQITIAIERTIDKYKLHNSIFNYYNFKNDVWNYESTEKDWKNWPEGIKWSEKFSETFDIIYDKLNDKYPNKYPEHYISKLNPEMFKLKQHLNLYIKSYKNFINISDKIIEQTLINIFKSE